MNLRLAGPVGLAQRVAPALARSDAVQVDEHVLLVPAIGNQPALEGEGSDVVDAGVRYEKTRHSN